MIRKQTLLVLLTMLPLFIVAQSDKKAAKNVLIIYSDDQSYNTIHALGNPEIRTPNLDRLVNSGLSFTQAYVMGGPHGAVCIPSRAMMLTGRYLGRLPDGGRVIPDSLISVPEILQKIGYTTFHSGKWHSDKASHHRMFNSGDNIFFGGMNFEKDGGQVNPAVFHYDSTGVYPSSDKVNSDTFSSQLYTNAVVRFLESPLAKDKPFFCYLAFTSPHDPRTPPAEFLNWYKQEEISLPPNFLPEHPFDNGDLKVRDELLLPHPRTAAAVRKEIALYYAMVSEMDAQVGRVLDALEETGLKENTLIIFAGDNGLAVGQHGLLGKQSLYEHSIRVPMIMAGPGIPENKTTTSLTYLSDIAPTVLHYLNVPRPATLEAKSLLPVILEPSTALRENMYNAYGHWSRSVRTRDGFKLIEYNVKGVCTTQLFELSTDPWEMKNLARDPAYAEKLLQLRKLLKDEMRKAHDGLNIELQDWGRKINQKSYGS